MNSTLVDPRDYKIGPDSMPQRGVPKGRIIPFEVNRSRIFPGTKRKGWIYVPRQYRREHPAAVMVVQDGAHHMTMKRPWRLPVVFDNLIHKNEIPVSIGIFLEPGIVPATAKKAEPRRNRSFEYDTLGDRYARFLIDEILPLVGRRYNLTDDPNGRMLLGGSSGALCSFNVAWERPDAFRRVFSCVGSYVNLRGGNIFPSLVRLSEPRPLRVFLQSGTADLDVFGGNWWAANVDMLAALKYSGYEVNHAWGVGGHDDHHGSSIFVDALRWLWKGYPRPVRAGGGKKNPRQSLMRVLVKGQTWRPLRTGAHAIGRLAVTAGGKLYGLDVDGRVLVALSDKANPVVVKTLEDPATDLSAALGERILLCQPRARQMVLVSTNGRTTITADCLDAHAACMDSKGEIYAADPAAKVIWRIARDKKRTVAMKVERPIDGLIFSLDETQLIAVSRRQRQAWVFQHAQNGLLDAPAPYFQLHLGYDIETPGATQSATGGQKATFFATESGLQLANGDGTVAGLIDKPGVGTLTGVALGGGKRDQLYVACEGKVFRREINPRGEPGF